MKRAKRKDKNIFWAEAPEVVSGIDAWKLVLIRFALVLSGAYLLLAAVCQGFDLEVKPSIYPIIALTAVYGLFAAYRGKWAALVLLPGALYLGRQCYLKIKFLEDGVYHLENVFIRCFNYHYGSSINSYVTHYSEKRSLTWLLTVALILITIVLVAVVMKRHLRFLWVVCVTAVLAVLLLVNVFPSMFVFLTLIVHCVTVVWAGKIENCDSAEKGKIIAGIVGFLTICMLLCSLVCGESAYTELIKPSDWRLEMQDKILNIDPEEIINRWGDKLDELWNKKGADIGNKRVGVGMAGGILDRGGHGGLEVTGETHLIVTIPSNINVMYLRGYVGAVYNGTAWRGAPENAEWRDVDTSVFDSTTYTGKLIHSFFNYGRHSYWPLWNDGYRMREYASEMKVQIVGADNRFLYAPYDTYDDYGYGYHEAENALRNKRRHDNYELRFCYNEYNLPFFYAFPNGRMDMDYLARSDYANVSVVQAALLGEQGDVMAKLAKYQETYRKYVDSVYLDIPEQCANVKDVLTSTGSLEGDVAQVVSFLQENYSYTLDPVPLKKGEDYIENFLFKSHAGYCMHFASAAVMLYRSLGIPARYVEGYYVNTALLESKKVYTPVENNEKLEVDGKWWGIAQDYVEVEVPDACAHAWVEIYIDNYGWCPIEVTSGYLAIDPEEVPIPTISPNTPTPTKAPTNTPTKAPTEKPEVTVTEGVTPVMTPVVTPEITQPDITQPVITQPVITLPGNKPSKPPVGPEGEPSIDEGEDDGTPDSSKKETSGSAFGKMVIVILPWFIGAVLLALLVVLVVNGYQSLRERRRKALSSGEKNRRVYRCYAEIVKLLRIAGVRQKSDESESEFFARAEAFMREQGKEVSVMDACHIAEKTRFSENGADAEDADRMFAICKDVTEAVRIDLKGFAKIRFAVAALLK